MSKIEDFVITSIKLMIEDLEKWCHDRYTDKAFVEIITRRLYALKLNLEGKFAWGDKEE